MRNEVLRMLERARERALKLGSVSAFGLLVLSCWPTLRAGFIAMTPPARGEAANDERFADG